MPYNIHCEKCGHEFEVEKWHPGMECPKCQATDTVPKTRIGEDAPEQKLSWIDEKSDTSAPGWKNSPSVAAIAVVVIVLIWVGLGYWKFKKPKRMKVEIWATCTECSDRVKKFTDEVRKGADCVKCDKKNTVYTLYECRGQEDEECDNTFVYIPPKSPRDPYRNQKDWEKMSEAERNKQMAEADKWMMEYEQAQMEATKCPKCGSYNTGPIYTEEQKKKFAELRKKYEKKKKRK